MRIAFSVKHPKTKYTASILCASLSWDRRKTNQSRHHQKMVKFDAYCIQCRTSNRSKILQNKQRNNQNRLSESKNLFLIVTAKLFSIPKKLFTFLETDDKFYCAEQITFLSVYK